MPSSEMLCREQMAEAELVTIVHLEGAGRDSAGAAAELERRNIVATRDLNHSIKRFESTSARLTWTLIGLTAVLVILTVAVLVLAIRQS